MVVIKSYRFFPLHASILVPSFNLDLRKPEGFRKVDPIRRGEVLLGFEPFLQPDQLELGEHGATSPTLLGPQESRGLPGGAGSNVDGEGDGQRTSLLEVKQGFHRETH